MSGPFYLKILSDIILSKLIATYITLVFFFPLFPTIMKNSQIHINFITLICSISLVFLFRRNLAFRATVNLAGYFLIMQLLILLSTYFGLKHETLSMSSVFSALRPTLLFILYLSCSEICRRYNFFESKELKYIIFISFVYVVFEVFFLQYSRDIITLLYKRDFRPELFFAGTTFFGTTYYSGYVFYCLFLLSFVNLFNRRRFSDKVIFIMAFFLVLISLSKTMIVALLFSFYFMVLIYFRSAILRGILFFLPVLFVSLLFLFQSEISQMLQDAGVPALRSINTLLYDSSNSGSLNTRTEQVVESFALGQSYSVLFGAGLGQDASIESLPAVYLYRYGLLGLIVFYLYSLILMIFALYKCCLSNKKDFAINFSLLLWAVTLPITQLSGSMIEQSKMALISALMLGYLFHSNSEPRLNNA